MSRYLQLSMIVTWLAIAAGCVAGDIWLWRLVG